MGVGSIVFEKWKFFAPINAHSLRASAYPGGNSDVCPGTDAWTQSVCGFVSPGSVFGGRLTGRAGWFDMVESAVWLPLIFLFQLKGASGERPPPTALLRRFYAALGMGMTALAGRVHILFMDALLVIAAASFLPYPNQRIQGIPPDSRRDGCRRVWLWRSSGLRVSRRQPFSLFPQWNMPGR